MYSELIKLYTTFLVFVTSFQVSLYVRDIGTGKNNTIFNRFLNITYVNIDKICMLHSDSTMVAAFTHVTIKYHVVYE